MAKIPIQLLLLDGTTDGQIKRTIRNGVETVFRIPRNTLASCVDIDELKHGGIYFLFGERDGRSFIYVGQTVSGLFDKLLKYDRADKNFWTEAIVFTTVDNFFSARELVYLKNKLCVELKAPERLFVPISDDDCPDYINNFDEFIRTVLNAKFNKSFEPPKVEPLTATPVPPKVESPAAQDNGEIFYLKQKVTRLNREVNAKMRCPTAKQCIVLADSVICTSDNDNSPLRIKKLRRSAKIDANGKLREDVELSSPTAAAIFVTGNKAERGPEIWKTKNGVTWNDFLGRG